MDALNTLLLDARDFFNRVYTIQDMFKNVLTPSEIRYLRDRAKGEGKKTLDRSKWYDLTYFLGVNEANVAAFLKNYEELYTVITNVSPKRDLAKNQKALEAIKKACTIFEKNALPLFAEIDAWVNALSLDNFKASPAFDIADFENELRKAKEFNIHGNLMEAHTKLTKIGFLRFLENA